MLNRSRKANSKPPCTLKVDDNSLVMHFDAQWLGENPLTLADLDREQLLLREVGYELAVESA